MLLVKTELRPSPIHGLGLFAAEDILLGAVIWRFQIGFDQILPAVCLEYLPAPAISYIENHCYMGQFVLITGDHDRFINSSDDPNTEFSVSAMESRAILHIKKGEEITENYAVTKWV